jgi:IS30 family transposase
MRNCDRRNGNYRASLAHRRCKKRHSDTNKKNTFTEEVEDYVIQWFKEYYSIEQIVGKAVLDGVNCVSIERIYRFIWDDKKKSGEVYKHLRTQGKHYKQRGASKDKRGQIVGRVGIEKRSV